MAGCGDDDDPMTPEQMSAFSLEFAAVFNGQEVGCGDQVTVLGRSGSIQMELSDLRFYVSNLRFVDESGKEVDLVLDENPFQYKSAAGDVTLIDLTDTSEGACAGTGLSFPEGTARTNRAITGMSYPDRVRGVRFDVGVPQAVQKAVIANHTAEDAPSPLREMHWSWGYAYRNFVMNFTLSDGAVDGEGYVHIGSTGCGGDGSRALTDQQSCGRPNTAAVSLGAFSIAADTVAVDIGALLANVDFVVQVDESTTAPGVACHSSPNQTDCPVIFANLGIAIVDGGANAAANSVFSTK
jgi:uncharacterized repeat protein (TIGR04052 family)